MDTATPVTALSTVTFLNQQKTSRESPDSVSMPRCNPIISLEIPTLKISWDLTIRNAFNHGNRLRTSESIFHYYFTESKGKQQPLFTRSLLKALYF